MAFINYLVHLAILIGVYGILAVSLDFAVGFTGMLNLGHVAFFGIGAYVSALLAVNGMPVFASIFCGVIVAAIFGVFISIPTTRLKGDYLALATLGFTFIMGSVARNWTGLTRGALGIPGIPRVASSNVKFLFIVLTLLAFSLLFFRFISRTSFGRRCEAVRDDELAAKMLGHDTFLIKTSVLGLSAAFAGLGGALFAHYITFIDPSIFGLGDVVLLVSMIIVGGLASVRGALIGTVLILLLPEPLRFIGFPSSLIGPLREILYSLILLVILIWSPRGISGKVDLS